jgi:hypothetical protein
MANWNNPTLTSLYTDFLSELKARDTDLALQFDSGTLSNLVTGTIRWDSSANRWKKWSGSAWAELTTTYALTGLSTTGAAGIGGALTVTGAAALNGGGTSTTPATNDNSTAIATTAYVRAQAYAPLAGPALTGVPTAPTAAVNTNTTQLATTAFVIGQGADVVPPMNGTAAVGTSLEFARGDHVHPTDTSRAPLASPTFTGTPAAPTAAVGTNTTQLATTAFVQAEIANDAPAKDGTGATGTWGISVTGNAATATTLATARTINGVSFNGSANITVTASTPAALTAGTYLTSGGTFDGALARTFAVDATSANTASKVVARDASGNFSAGTITANLTGSASGNQPISAELTGIAGLAGTSGLIRKTAAGAYSLDTNTYATTTGTGATGTWGISITGSAASLGGVSSNRAILKRRTRINTTDGTSLNSSISTPEMGFTYGGSGEPPGPFIAFGGLNGDIDYSCQLVGAYSGGNDFKIRTRNDDAAAWNPWRTILTDGNYTSYSPSLTGGGASGTWGINVTGNAGTATTASNLSGFTNSNLNTPVAGPDSLTNNGHAYVTGVSLFGQVDGALYAQGYNASWVHQIYGDYRTGQIAVRGRNSGTWTSWRTVLDSSNYTNYAAASVSAAADQAIVNQHNGANAAWYGRILSKNSTVDRAVFLGTYPNVAGVFAHNNALNAWADLYVNTVDGVSGGIVRLQRLALGSTAANANVGFRNSRAVTGGTTAWAQYIDGTVQSDVTATAVGIGTSLSTVGSQSISSLIHYQAATGTLGASTTLTNQIGFSASSTLDGATNNYGFYGAIASGANNWNCFMVGTAPNYFAGQVQVGAGSLAAPSLATNGDTNTGIYWPAADELAFVEGGQEAARIDNTGRLLLGTSTYINGWNTSQKLIISGTGNEGIGVFTTAGPCVLAMTRSGGTDPAAFALVASETILGLMSWSGGDGFSRVAAARVQAVVDGNPSFGVMPGRIEIMTTPPASGTPSEAWRVTSDRVVAYNQSAPAAVNATATLTVANLKTGIITSTSAAATDMTLPTGTLTEAGFNGIYTNLTFQWSVINTGPSLVRVLAGTAHTIVGSGSVATGTSGRFASRRTAANTFVTYRLS